jgi:hypothetical protein
LGELFECFDVNGVVRIRTPFLYPDGDVIDLFVKSSTDMSTVTDLGETLRWLRAQSLSSKRSLRQTKLIEDVAVNHGLEFYRGMLQARARTPAELASVVMRVGEGAVRVADIWFTMRTRLMESVTDEVEAFLTERQVPFERAQTLVGRSGKTWTVDFHTRLPQKSSLVLVLSTGSRGASRRISEHAVATWYDLSHLRIGPEGQRFVSLFDDTMDVWAPDDFKLVEDLSAVARWSQPEEFLQAIAA